MSPSGDTISHHGTIEKVDNQSVYVKILSSSACASCNVKGACQLAESEEKVIEVIRQQDQEYSVGKPVDIVMQRSSGTRAVLLAYFLPFCIVVLSLVVFIATGMKEGISALLSMFLLVPYYFILYQFRGRLKKEFEFTIH